MFKNEPPADFSLAATRADFSAALDKIDAQILEGGYTVYPLLNSNQIEGTDSEDSVDPSDPRIAVGKVHYASAHLAERAVQFLSENGAKWRRTPFKERAEIILAAGELLRKRRIELAALIVREAAKPWREADADVTEAIDFCVYYAQEMLRLGAPRRLAEVPGEDDFYLYKPRGVAVVIAPWNFPLAIACGMTVASLVCGNPTILKPAEQTSIIADHLAKILFEAGVPREAFAFMPGRGEVTGRALVNHPSTALICFTGSKAVGLEILRSTSELKEGQTHLKRAILELGGKNCIVIDEDADLDEAIKGVIYSAFGFSGQKCSACSRVVVVGDTYEPFLSRLKEAASDLLIGRAQDPATLVGPVIDKASAERIMNAISEGKETETVLFQSPKVPSEGYFVPPTIFRDVGLESSLWTEEIFGPVLSCRKATDFEEALNVANGSQYALTGGVFSRSPKNIALARETFEVGNLYINRGCTGALVQRHPFGGFKLSGVGSKAGGPDYLLQFMEPVSVAENTMRRGFAPE